jgi:hypothetical protein
LSLKLLLAYPPLAFFLRLALCFRALALTPFLCLPLQSKHVLPFLFSLSPSLRFFSLLPRQFSLTDPFCFYRLALLFLFHVGSVFTFARFFNVFHMSCHVLAQRLREWSEART